MIGPGQRIPHADLVVLPGSKSVITDMAWLRTQGWETYLQGHLRYGGKVLGLRGGFQMLGLSVHDPYRMEGGQDAADGLGWLDMGTTLGQEKQLRRVSGRFAFAPARLAGYEIHLGRTEGRALASPLVHLDDGHADGAMSEDGQVAGTYVHGLLDHPEALSAILSWAGVTEPATQDIAQRREADLNRLADAVEAHLDLERLVLAACRA